MNIRHYHVVERSGTDERVVATFSSAFQAGRDMALREQAQRAIERASETDRESAGRSFAADTDEDAGRRPAPARRSTSYVECSCTTTPAAAR